VWKLTENYTQAKAAEALGWSREAVTEKHGGIIGASFSEFAPEDESDGAPGNGATATKSPFTAGLLRNTLDLTPSQQLELCRKLAKGKNEKKAAAR